MRQILLITLGAILAVSIIVFGFTFNQVNQERLNLSADLQYRTRLLADSLTESVGPNFLGNSTTTLQRIVDRFTDRERIVGIAVFNNHGIVLAASREMPKRVTENPDFVFIALDKGEPTGLFETIGGVPLYLHVSPLFAKSSSVSGALVVVQNASYIDTALISIWKRNAVRLLVQIAVFSAAIVLLVRFALLRITRRFVESVKSARAGKADKAALGGPFFLKPIASEIMKMNQSLTQARFAASEEARMRLEKLDTPWTAERLKEFIKAHLKGRKIFVVSNREPYIHRHAKGKIEYSVVANGMNTALESLMEACGGTWIAHGSGDADRETVDVSDKLMVPPDEPKYTLKRVWLTEDDVKEYYSFAVEGMWPLCHMTHTRPIFRKRDWERYREVNGTFAQVVLSEIKNTSQPVILVQDYHFTLLPRMIKKSRPDAQVGIFWHAPWPSSEQFSICPERKGILTGMLGADVIGFNTQQFCNNFLDTVGKEIESLIDFEQFSVTRDEHVSLVRSFPISIAFTNTASMGGAAAPDRSILRPLGVTSKFFGMGVERLDYIKGIPERLKGIEFFLDAHPEFRGKFTFLQIASPHRENIEKYQEYRELVIREAERVNKKFATKEWEPIVLELEQYSHQKLMPLYRIADVCMVTSLHDSMNLVSKEYVAERSGETGALILSKFAGAARDLKGALVVNPYSAEEISDALYNALTMSRSEQHRRMKTMRNAVRNYNVYRWAAELIKAVASLG